ncbi:MAG: hypothetical protein WBB94_03200 [Candidatus Saccharimonadaceae bacterium]
MQPEQNEPDYSKPVAYDAEGKPLYAHPPESDVVAEPDYEKVIERDSHVTAAPPAEPGSNFDPKIRRQYGNEPEVFHTTRPIEPHKMVISDEIKRKHEESVRKFPFLNLSPGEYVILHVRRHPIGLLVPVLVTSIVIVLIIAILLGYPMIVDMQDPPVSYDTLVAIALPLIILIGLFGYVAVWIYTQNKFFMTNESVIQEIQQSLFARHEQSVSLGSIEDASFKQNGLIPTLLNYGTLRLSTEGEETTYRFQYVADPKVQTAIITNAVEAFKNGRPVPDEAID